MPLLGAAPRAWASAPEALKAHVHATACAAAPRVLQGILDDVRDDEASGRGFSLVRLVDRVLTASPRLMSAMFIRCGWDELVFIRNFGATMGGLLGLVQMGIWFEYRAFWLLPAFGLTAGALTNWVALAMIFYPRHPVSLCAPLRLCASRCCCCCYCCCGESVGEPPLKPTAAGGCCVMQGLFIKRQAQVSAVYARIVATVLVTPSTLLYELCYDIDRLRESCRTHTSEIAHEILRNGGVLGDGAGGEGATAPGLAIGSLKGLARGALTRVVSSSYVVGTDALDEAVERACAVVCERLPGAIKQSDAYVGEALRLEETLRERMAALPPEDFEPLLHSVFKSDEWKLFVVGGVLGLAIGISQQAAFTSFGLS